MATNDRVLASQSTGQLRDMFPLGASFAITFCVDGFLMSGKMFGRGVCS